MSRYGFLFRIESELKDEFKKAHAEIWPELKKEIRTKWEIYMDRYFIKESSSYLGPEVTVLEEIFHLE